MAKVQLFLNSEIANCHAGSRKLSPDNGFNFLFRKPPGQLVLVYPEKLLVVPSIILLIIELW